MDRIGLKIMYDAWNMSVINGVINAFIRRWHNEISLFHLPIEEMVITLNDVACLLIRLSQVVSLIT